MRAGRLELAQVLERARPHDYCIPQEAECNHYLQNHLQSARDVPIKRLNLIELAEPYFGGPESLAERL